MKVGGFHSKGVLGLGLWSTERQTLSAEEEAGAILTGKQAGGRGILVLRADLWGFAAFGNQAHILCFPAWVLEFLPSNNLFQSNHRLCAHRAGRRQILLQKAQEKNKLLKLLLKQPLRLSIFVLQKSGAWLIVSGYSRTGLLETEPSFPKPPLLNLPLLTSLRYKITRSQVLITHILQWFLRAQYCWNLRESHQEPRPLKRPGFDVVFSK